MTNFIDTAKNMGLVKQRNPLDEFMSEYSATERNLSKHLKALEFFREYYRLRIEARNVDSELKKTGKKIADVLQ